VTVIANSISPLSLSLTLSLSLSLFSLSIINGNCTQRRPKGGMNRRMFGCVCNQFSVSKSPAAKPNSKRCNSNSDNNNNNNICVMRLWQEAWQKYIYIYTIIESICSKPHETHEKRNKIYSSRLNFLHMLLPMLCGRFWGNRKRALKIIAYFGMQLTRE